MSKSIIVIIVMTAYGKFSLKIKVILNETVKTRIYSVLFYTKQHLIP